jgi:hypothetical protein
MGDDLQIGTLTIGSFANGRFACVEALSTMVAQVWAKLLRAPRGALDVVPRRVAGVSADVPAVPWNSGRL